MSNETKAPGKIITVLLGVVVLLVIAVYLLAKLATGGFDVNAEVMTKEAVAARLKPVGEAKASDALKDLGEDLDEALAKLGETAMHMGKKAMSADVMSAFAFAHPFLEATGDVIMAWLLLWRANVASKKVESAKKDRDFYIGQMKSAEFFIESILPVSLGKMNAILKTSRAAIEVSEEAFG